VSQGVVGVDSWRWAGAVDVKKGFPGRFVQEVNHCAYLPLFSKYLRVVAPSVLRHKRQTCVLVSCEARAPHVTGSRGVHVHLRYVSSSFFESYHLDLMLKRAQPPRPKAFTLDLPALHLEGPAATEGEYRVCYVSSLLFASPPYYA